MLKTLVTLMRGRSAVIAEAVADRNALAILDQQMRDAAAALDRAKKALAVAIAQDAREAQRLDVTRSRIGDLEARAVAAITAGSEDLAAEAAEALAGLEAECEASESAHTLFVAEIAKLRDHVCGQQARLSQLERGRRVARAAESVRVARRGRIEAAPIFEGTLADAEAALARLRDRQIEAEAAEAAFEALDAATAPTAVAEKLAAKGFGPRLKPSATDILARLRRRAAAGEPPAGP